jgi:hypothetical protein
MDSVEFTPTPEWVAIMATCVSARAELLSMTKRQGVCYALEKTVDEAKLITALESALSLDKAS